MNTTNIDSFKLTKNSILEIGIITLAFFALSFPFFTNAATLDRQLEQGMTGSDISTLQIFLAQDKEIYPQGLVTGYFGPLTFAAVSNFQSRNGISTVGRVGPITLAAINDRMSGGIPQSGADVYAPNINNIYINRSNNTATFSWTTNEVSKGVVYYSTSPLITYEYPHTVNVSGNTAMTDTSYRNTQNVYVTGLQANITYYYMLYVTDASGNVTVTLPATFQSI